jgi:hypothetical protein
MVCMIWLHGHHCLLHLHHLSVICARSLFVHVLSNQNDISPFLFFFFHFIKYQGQFFLPQMSSLPILHNFIILSLLYWIADIYWFCWSQDIWSSRLSGNCHWGDFILFIFLQCMFLYSPGVFFYCLWAREGRFMVLPRAFILMIIVLKSDSL